MARIRVVTLNMEQDHKRWELRRELIADQLVALEPDLLALNEVSVPLQTAHWMRSAAKERMGIDYALVQQTKVNALAGSEAEALLTRFTLMETGHLDYQARDMVALVARIDVDGTPVDVYVTHLYRSRGDDSLRLYQVQQLLSWIDSRQDAAARIVCGDFNATLDSHRLRSWRHGSGPRSRPLLRLPAWPQATAPCRIPIGRVWIGASTISGCPRRSRSSRAECASISPAQTMPRCGHPITQAFGPISICRPQSKCARRRAPLDTSRER